MWNKYSTYKKGGSMKKLLALLGVVGMVAMWSGCGLTDPTDANITATINSISTVTVNSGAVSFTVKVESDSEITQMTYKVTQGGTDKTTNFTIIPPNVSVYDGKKNVTLDFSISAKSSATAGDYDFYIKIDAGDINDDDTRSFTVEGDGGTPVTTSTVTLGSLSNATLGSSVDLDANPPDVMLATDAKKSGSGVDLVGTYSSDLSAMRIFNPVYAKESSNISAFSSRVDPAATSFVKVSGTAFNAITTVEQIKPLYDAGTSVTSASVLFETGSKGLNLLIEYFFKDSPIRSMLS